MSSGYILPLYHDDERELRHVPDTDPHLGLWYEKFPNRWYIDKKDDKWKLEKQEWFQTVTGVTGNRAMIDEAIERQLDLVEALQGHALVMKTKERFVTGLGRSHPVENGFSWHATLGTAFLPGSSVKGMVRAWAEQWAEKGADRIERIFGSKQEGADHVGSVIFFDALPISPVKLESEIMTPHYSGYYQDPTKPAEDWYNPVPIPFLTVAREQSFLFSFAPRKTAREEELQLVKEWLKEALAWIGAGAKTAVGYGRFAPDEVGQQRLDTLKEERQKERARKQELARMSPIKREMVEDGYDHPQSEMFMKQITEKWLPRLADEGETDRVEIAQHLATWYQKHRPEHWIKPNKKNKPKVELIKRILSQA